MDLGRWLRRVFSSGGLDEEAVEREEYRLPDRGEASLRSGRFGTYASQEGADAAEEALDELKAPPDPNP